MFVAGIYNADGCVRWGVLHTTSCVWYFSARYGRRAAEAYARRLNRPA